jgi:5-methylcytosine-specific restriction endonuclease McrA
MVVIRSPRTWTDQLGIVRRVPSRHQKRLRPSKIPLHRALRSFIFWRDFYKCVRCATPAIDLTLDQVYRGERPLTAVSSRRPGDLVSLVMDHRVSQRNGGTNHPDNLQTLCDDCNGLKATLEDRGARYGRRPLRTALHQPAVGL